jgi:hypothetical protein
VITPTPGAVPRAAPTDPVRPRQHAPIRSKELTMLTFKEALCLLAIVVAIAVRHHGAHGTTKTPC